jgi:hypothetical protein
MLSLGLVACGSSNPTPETVTMMAQGSSGESGTAVLTSTSSGGTMVVITLTGGTDTGAQASHIHNGVCGSNGSIAVPLNSVQGGSASTTISNSLSSLMGGKYYINVHNSADLNTIQTCGNIQ